MVNLPNPIPTRQLVVIFRCIPIKSPLGLGLVYTQDIRSRYTDLFFLIYHQLFPIYWISRSTISPIKIEPVLDFPLCQYELPTMSILFWASSLYFSHDQRYNIHLGHQISPYYCYSGQLSADPLPKGDLLFGRAAVRWHLVGLCGNHPSSGLRCLGPSLGDGLVKLRYPAW